MKKYISIVWMMFLSIIVYSQLNVATDFIENTNTLRAQYHFFPGEDVSQDLFFSIGPNGIPQYGRTVAWNLSPGTNDLARFHHVKKGDWDISAIRTVNEEIDFLESDINHPEEDTPNVDMGDEWIKLGQSWNFSHNSYAIAIVSFTNRKNSKIEKGKIRFSHVANSNVVIEDIYIYNQWVQLSGSYIDPSTGRRIYEFDYADLTPQEIRHLYLKVNVYKPLLGQGPDIDLKVEMVGFQSDGIIANATIPPHDPNALYLLTALENTTTHNDCGVYSSFPDLQETCEEGKPYWIWCPNINDVSCKRLKYSLNYPYCNIDSEVLKYRITCLNDGAGFASKVEMQNIYNLVYPSVFSDSYENESPFEANLIDYMGSHDVNGSFSYPEVNFEFSDINLPGLDDPYTVYTYDECSAHVTFEVQTLCNIEKTIRAQAGITFFDTDGTDVGEILTNNVTTVPEQGEYTNYEPECISCDHYNRSVAGNQEITLRNNSTSLNVTFERNHIEEHVSLQVIDVSGNLLLNRKISSNGNVFVNEDIDISNHPAGIYLLSIQIGDKNYVKKFIRH